MPFSSFSFFTVNMFYFSEEEYIFLSLSRPIEKSVLVARIFSSKTFLYVAFTIFSALGTRFHGYFFAAHLLLIVKGNPLLLGIIRAVTQNGW